LINQTYVNALPQFLPLRVDYVPYNESSTLPTESNCINIVGIVSFCPLDWISSQLGIDILNSTIVFVSNLNRDPSEGPVGAFYFINHFPLLGKCIRGVDDRCLVGYGIKATLLTLLYWLVIFALIVNLVFPPVSNFLSILSIFTGGVFLSSLVVSFIFIFSWGYNLNCAVSGGIPTLPECAFNDIKQLVEDFINPPCGLFQSLQPLWQNRDLAQNPYYTNTSQGCPLTCPQVPLLESCVNIAGFNSLWSIAQYDFCYNLPDACRWLNSTCLVTGSCLLPHGNSISTNSPYSGILSFLIPRNTTILELATKNQSFQICLSLFWPTRLFWFFAVFAVLAAFTIVIIPLIRQAIVGIYWIFLTPPLVYLLPIPVGPNGEAFTYPGTLMLKAKANLRNNYLEGKRIYRAEKEARRNKKMIKTKQKT
jgi:hypothetical protein